MSQSCVVGVGFQCLLPRSAREGDILEPYSASPNSTDGTVSLFSALWNVSIAGCV